MSELLSLFALMAMLSGSIQLAYGDQPCVLGSLNSLQNGLTHPIAKEVQAGCSAHSDSWYSIQCCKNVDGFLNNKKNNPIPCSGESLSKYQINLAITVCGKLTRDNSDCLDAMARLISDKRVIDIADDCLAQSNRASTRMIDFESQVHLNYSGSLQGEGDQGCLNRKLKSLAKLLDIDLVNAPPDQASCPQTQASDEKTASKKDASVGPSTPEGASGIPNTGAAR